MTPAGFLPTESSAPPKGRFAAWLYGAGRLDEPHETHESHPWYLVLWLTGVDYFSTLGYQPGIALLAAGIISPLATAVLVLVTLACALPVYAQVSRRSFAGQGSIAMLENLFHGWTSKLFVLVLLGFAATDFVITMTLSAADAAQHAIENPYLHHLVRDAQMPVTIVLLAALAAVFLKGFKEAIGFATIVCIPYLLLNVVVLSRCLIEIVRHPSALPHWTRMLDARGDWTSLAIAAVIAFPQLALGLSGFETGVSVMPLIKGRPGDGTPPEGRIANTRKLLGTAAIIMSVFLMLSSFVTTLLIPESAYKVGGPASGRAIAYLAHEYLGNVFGSFYDFSTILILWFAGASAMAGLLNLVPRYMPRLGMAPIWAAHPRPLVLVLLGIDIIVTVIFKAGVEAQGGAYATGVLVLMLSAAIAAAVSLIREARKGEAKYSVALYCWLVAGVFAYTLITNIIERPDGVIIASCFILAILIVSAVSRYRRATELRISGICFADDESHELWHAICGKQVNLVPVRTNDVAQRKAKEKTVREHYNVRGPLAFVHVKLLDNRSEFFAPLDVMVRQDGDCFIVEAAQAVAIANTIAYLSELLDPISIFLGLSRKNLMQQAIRFVLWGEGESGLLVYQILLRYWEFTPEDDVRPMIFLMSD